MRMKAFDYHCDVLPHVHNPQSVRAVSRNST
jgi:hypothetical protein